MLQATSADIIKAYNNINLVQTQLQVLRKDCDQVFDESIWKNATHMATIAETELIAPRICQRMTKRSNIPAGSSKDYFKVAVLIPTIDHLLSELEFRFSQIQVHVACGMYLIPKNLQDMSSVHRDNIFQFFEWAFPTDFQSRTWCLETDMAWCCWWCTRYTTDLFSSMWTETISQHFSLLVPIDGSTS